MQAQPCKTLLYSLIQPRGSVSCQRTQASEMFPRGIWVVGWLVCVPCAERTLTLLVCVSGSLGTATGGRQNLLHTRWIVSRPKQHGADSAYLAPHGCPRHGPPVRCLVGRSRSQHQGMGGERSWCVVHVRGRYRREVQPETRASFLPLASPPPPPPVCVCVLTVR